MLDIKKISPYTPYSKEWDRARIGMLTASEISCIMKPKGIDQGGMTYILSKVGEAISGLPSGKSILTEDMARGHENEPISLKYFQETQGIEVMLTDKHLIHDERYSVTPDAIRIVEVLGDKYNCETVETKAYRTYATHIRHCECTSPQELKSINPKVYWQVIMQMHVADTLRGHALFYHPDFPETSRLRQGHVLFKKTELAQDFTLLRDRMEETRGIFNEKYNYLKTKI